MINSISKVFQIKIVIDPKQREQAKSLPKDNYEAESNKKAYFQRKCTVFFLVLDFINKIKAFKK